MITKLSNKLQDFSSEFNETPPPINFEKEIMRWGKNNHLWAIAHRWEFRGDWYGVLHCGTWKDPLANKEFKSWDEYQQTSKHFNLRAKEELELLKVRLEDEKQKKHKACAEKWQPIYEQAKQPPKNHWYLEKKRIGPYISRLHNSTLLIPFYNVNGFTGVQMIYLDDNNEGQKRFSKGIQLRGSICPLTPFRSAEYCYLSEGFATAATIQEAFPKIPSIMGINAGNLTQAIYTIRDINPDIKIVIAADRDESGTGKKYAEIAKRTFKNVAVKLPEFEERRPEWSDFNDLALAENLGQVRKQLRISKALFMSINALGVNGGTYYYTTDENPQIISLDIGKHTEAHFCSLITDKFWWQANYGFEDKDGNIKVSWPDVRLDLVGKCHEKGVFTPDNIRGLGLWLEENQTYVINNGRVALGQPDESKYYYIKKRGFNLVKNPNIEPAYNFCKMLAEIHCKKPIGNAYLVAWWVQSHIFPVLPWRFHLWLTGSRGTGKSTILKYFKQSSPFTQMVQDTTAAGLRQKFGSDMKAILYDEAEPTNKKVPSAIDLARESSSNDGAKTLRGTAGGKAIEHNTQMNFLFSSIQTPNMQAADKSRFLEVELASIKGQPLERHKEMQEIAKAVEYKPMDFFSWAVNHLDFVEKAKEAATDKLRGDKIDARQADTLSTVIACISIFDAENGTPEQAVEKVMATYDFFNTEYVDESKIDDSELALDELMDIIIDMKTSDTVASAVSELRLLYKNSADKEELETFKNLIKPLAAHGMKYLHEKNALFIYHKNRNLIRKMDKYPNFADVMARDKSMRFEKGVTYRLYGGKDKNNKMLKGCILYLDE